MEREEILAQIEALSDRAMALRSRARGLRLLFQKVLDVSEQLRALSAEAAEIDVQIAALFATLRDGRM
jgi:hypothetical protein